MKGEKVSEGGLARNSAWEKWIEVNDQIETLNLSNSSFKNVWIVFKTLLFSKNKKIFFLYPTVGVPILNSNILRILISKIFLLILSFSSRRNQVIFDVSDLKYEQSIDLDINHKDRKHIKKFEKIFFKTKAKFVFTSFSMRDYMQSKYDLNNEVVDVCINGGDLIRPTKNYSISIIDKEKVNYVYAGTLNRGRQIEEMIESFPNNDDIQLILLGKDGEWINLSKRKNIYYLGALEENEAHSVVSQCDIGLIPYDEKKMYYNIAYPTKLSFYLTAGIPFLSTPVNEVKRITKEYGLGYLSSLENWGETIKSISKKDLEYQKNIVQDCMHEFSWTEILKNNKFL